MNIDLKQLCAIASALEGGKPQETAPGTPFPIGKPFFIRTVTHILTGVLVEVVPGSHFVLIDAAWIADTGRYSGALATAEFDEVEPYPDNQPLWVGWTAMIDACEIKSSPRAQK